MQCFHQSVHGLLQLSQLSAQRRHLFFQLRQFALGAVRACLNLFHEGGSRVEVRTQAFAQQLDLQAGGTMTVQDFLQALDRDVHAQGQAGGGLSQQLQGWRRPALEFAQGDSLKQVVFDPRDWSWLEQRLVLEANYAPVTRQGDEGRFSR